MRAPAIRWWLGLAFALLLQACGGGGGGGSKPNPTPSVGSVSGLVSSVAGTPLAGVAVASGTRSATTDAQGRYALAEVPVGDAVLSFTLAGHVTGFARVAVAKDAQALASPRLVPVARTQTLDIASGGTVAVPASPAQVVLPANGLVTAGGAAATGTVTVALTPIDPAAEPGSMPGNFTATAAGGGTTTIESFGALNVALTDAAGQKLNLGAGQTATIRIPLASRTAGAPGTIPLYWFNEQTGLWVQEGTATLQGSAPDQYYEGTVSHFSFWNADQPMETIFVNGCVQDAVGARVSGAWVQTEGVDYSGGAAGMTNAQGDFRVAMRRGGIASVFGQLNEATTNVVRVGPSQVDITLSECLVLSAEPRPPQLVVHPQSQGVQAGGFVLFSVQAIGAQPLRYQWRRNGVDIVGADDSYLVLQNVSLADQGARYTVVVSNAAGSITSDDAVLSVDQQVLPPLVTSAPQPVQVTAGQTASFSVAAQSRGGQLSFQWLRDGVDIAGATTTSYTTPATTLADNGARLSVRVSSTNGTSTVSSEAVLTVVAAPVAPQIVQQPAPASVNVGQSATFTVSASGTATLQYQWRRNGTAITGANQASYTTPATTLADNGAVFTVVVTNAAGNATSNGVTLTVRQPPVNGGVHQFAQAGTDVAFSVNYFNGAQGFDAGALVAVPVANPAAGAITVEPAGTAVVLEAAFAVTISNGVGTSFANKHLMYIKNGRFYIVDSDVAVGSSPAGRLVSTLTSNEICGQDGFPETETAVNVAAPASSWLFLTAPGNDGACFTADDSTRAIRFNMAAGDTALTLPGVPLQGILNPDGTLGGHIFREGTQVVRRDANLGGRTPLFTLAAPFLMYSTESFTPAPPGLWIFVDGNVLYGVRLSSPATRTPLTTLLAGERPVNDAASDGTTIFLPVNNPNTGGSRLLAIDAALQTTEVGSFNEQILNISLTNNRIAVQLGSSVVSLPKAGGVVTPLVTWGQSEFAGFVATSGENVYVPVTAFAGGVTSSRIEIASVNGGSRQTLADTAFAGFGWGRSVPLAFDFGRFEVLYLISPVGSATDHGGGTLRSLDGATRTTLFTYGQVQAAPPGVIFADQFDNILFGDPRLFTYFRSDGGGSASREVYFIDSDQNNSLVRVTNLVTAGVRPLPVSAVGRGRVLRGAVGGQASVRRSGR